MFAICVCKPAVMALAVINILVSVRKVTKEGSRSGEAFAITQGLYGLFRKGAGLVGVDFPPLEEDKTIAMLKEIKAGIEELTKKTERFNQSLAQQSEAGEAYRRVLHHVTEYTNRPKNDSVITAICNPQNGIHYHLGVLQNALVNSTPINLDHECWIKYMCKHCQDNAADEDFSWGFRPACEKFASMLALQRSAIEILRRAMEVTGEPAADIEEIEKTHYDAIEKQVEMFIPTFAEYWNETVKKSKPIKTAMTVGIYRCRETEIFLVSHNNDLYWIDEGPSLAKLSLGCKEKTTVLSLSEFKKSFPCNGFLSHKGKLYLIMVNGDIIEIDPDTGKKDILYNTPEFKKCTAVLSHGGYIYMISNNDLYRVDTHPLPIVPLHFRNGKFVASETHRPRESRLKVKVEHIGSGYTFGRLGAVPGKRTFYARILPYSSLFSAIHEIEGPARRGSATKSKVSDHWCSGIMRLVGHGKHLYVEGGFNVVAVDTENDYKEEKMTKNTYEPLILPFGGATVTVDVSHNLSILCHEHKDGERYRLEILKLKPYWVDPPKDWYEQVRPK